ncbi:MAG: bifunctional oligoribonuclease/PAP phosphatase NrnA [Clostridia bacterium]|nr:bifunctional oligoribonuclease/PAP phosphatase NrnA [Clostridia bacterium]
MEQTKKVTQNLNDIAQALLDADDFVILTHRYPDGDTVGSAFALCRTLQKIGKRARVIINGDLDKKFDYLMEDYKEQSFEYKTVVSVDIATENLLGDLRGEFEGNVDISIDHHASNNYFAKLNYVNASAAANAENIYELIKVMGVDIDRHTADAIYTGICTDTGCFKFTNVTSHTMRTAAKLMDIGCDSAEINRVMFDLKSMARIRLERAVLESLALYSGGKIAVINTMLSMEKELGVGDTDMDGIASIPRQIEGVVVGITIKEKGEKLYRVSIRTLGEYDASAIAANFEGGGHHAAAGCTLHGEFESARANIVEAAQREIARVDNIHKEAV